MLSGSGRPATRSTGVTIDLVQRSAHAPAETVFLRKVSPRIVTNTARARFTFTVCRRQEPFMAAVGNAANVCESAETAVDREVLLTGDAITTVTMTVTPRHAGRVAVEGVDIEYGRGPRHLWQRGTETTGPAVRLGVRN